MHNDSFKNHSNDKEWQSNKSGENYSLNSDSVTKKVYLILQNIQGKQIVDEDALAYVLNLLKRRIHVYQSLVNWDQ